MVLAAQLNSKELEEWVSQELNGYSYNYANAEPPIREQEVIDYAIA
jgi:hypothetical protein